MTDFLVLAIAGYGTGSRLERRALGGELDLVILSGTLPIRIPLPDAPANALTYIRAQTRCTSARDARRLGRRRRRG